MATCPNGGEKSGKLTALSGDGSFRRAYSRGANAANRLTVVYIRANHLEYNRYGVVASKKVGNAVVRNKARRRIKEILRQNFIKPEGCFHNKKGLDVIVVARSGISQASYAGISGGLVSLLRKLLHYRTSG